MDNLASDSGAKVIIIDAMLYTRSSSLPLHLRQRLYIPSGIRIS